MRKILLIIIIIVIIFIILNFYKIQKNTFDDITIFGLWKNIENKNEYEIKSQNTIEIDVYTTINSKMYRKIAPGSKGNFVIKFKRPPNSNYEINIIEKTSKPKNLTFLLGDKEFTTLEEMEEEINEKFKDTEKITINWEWKYYIDEMRDTQDTIDGKNAQKYLFEIKAIIEE